MKASEFIHSGYAVKLRSGGVGLVQKVGGNAKVVIIGDGYNYVSSYDEDFNYRGCGNHGPNVYDIMEVYGLIKGMCNYKDALVPSVANRKLIWKRPKVKKLTVAEVSKLLGYDVEVVAG